MQPLHFFPCKSCEEKGLGGLQVTLVVFSLMPLIYLALGKRMLPWALLR